MKPKRLRPQPLERLTDADPAQVQIATRLVGIAFDCPIHDNCRLAIPTTPFDGGPPVSWFRSNHVWQRTGDAFDTMTLAPSIDVNGDEIHDCHWHGFVREGRFETCGGSS